MSTAQKFPKDLMDVMGEVVEFICNDDFIVTVINTYAKHDLDARGIQEPSDEDFLLAQLRVRHRVLARIISDDLG